jgi:fibrillarin-like rRNA methylase
MATGRALSQSSLPRYLAKMVRRFNAVSTGRVNEETNTPSTPSVDTSYVTSYSIASNWINGFLPYSELRYRILPILEKYGIPRSMAYMFMAQVQHAYKQLVRKHDTTVDEVIARFYAQVFGTNDVQMKSLSIDPDKRDQLVSELLALAGINVEVITGV